MTEEKKEEIQAKIKEADAAKKLPLVGLYHQMIALYSHVDAYEKKSNVIGLSLAKITTESTKRISDVARGVTPITDELLGDKAEFFSETEISTIQETKPTVNPGYWLDVFEKVEMVGGLIEDEDKPLVRAIRTIEVTIPENENFEYSLIFHFDENEYIKNSSLEVHVTVDKNDEVIEMDSDLVEWKAGKCLTKKEADPEAKPKPDAKKKKGKKAKKAEHLRSFFQLFRSFTQEEVQGETEMPEDEVLAEYDPYLVTDVLSFIKNLILKYHTPSMQGVEIEDYNVPPIEGFDGEGDEAEDAAEDEEEEEEAPKKKSGKTGKKGQNPEECKKQ